MKMVKYLKGLFIFLLCCLYSPFLVEADVCDENTFERLRVISDTIQVHYEYLDPEDETLDFGNTIPYGYTYMITISGLTDEIFAVSDGTLLQEFRSSDAVDGNVTYYVYNNGQDLIIRFYPSGCDSKALRTVKLSLPVFNEYYYTIECGEIRDMGLDLEVCRKLLPNNLLLNDSKFYGVVHKYLDVEEELSWLDRLILFVRNPFVLVGIGLVLVFLIGGIIYWIRKRSVLE